MSDNDQNFDELNSDVAESPERRAFLKKAGRFAVVTPAAAAVLLSTSMDAEARGIFKSGGDKYRHKKARKKVEKIRKIRQKLKSAQVQEHPYGR